MMEQSQSQALDVCVLEAAANLVAEQMLPNDSSSLNKKNTSPDMIMAESSITEEEDTQHTATRTNTVPSTESGGSMMSAAQARKRRKDILTSHRKANEQLEQEEQAHHIALNAVLDDPSVEAALAYKRKHEAISKATETNIGTEEPTTTAVVVPAQQPPTAITANTGGTSLASSGSSCEGAAFIGTSTITAGASSQNSPMLNAVVTTDSKSKKTQIRYEPTVPMDKDQLTAWRREARRVRNRESAAASRMKTKERIQELEEQVGNWKQKYLDAMDRLKQLEGQQSRDSM